MTDRGALAELCLPWCVSRADRRKIIRIDHEPERRRDAYQLRVGDLDDPAVQAALATQVVRDDGTTSIELIRQRATEFETGQREPVIVPVEGDPESPAVFCFADAVMLNEACHRACGLYMAGIDTFEIRARIDQAQGGWLIYDEPSLRTV